MSNEEAVEVSSRLFCLEWVTEGRAGEMGPRWHCSPPHALGVVGPSPWAAACPLLGTHGAEQHSGPPPLSPQLTRVCRTCVYERETRHNPTPPWGSWVTQRLSPPRDFSLPSGNSPSFPWPWIQKGGRRGGRERRKWTSTKRKSTKCQPWANGSTSFLC